MKSFFEAEAKKKLRQRAIVVGVYKKDAGGGDNEENQNQIFIPFTAFSQAFNRGDRVGWMAITAEDGTPITAIKESIFKLNVPSKHPVSDGDVKVLRYALHSPIAQPRRSHKKQKCSYKFPYNFSITLAMTKPWYSAPSILLSSTYYSDPIISSTLSI